MKKIALVGPVLTCLLAACGGGNSGTTPPTPNIDPSGKWVATETVAGAQRAWDMNITSMNGKWSSTSTHKQSSGALDVLEISGTHTLAVSYPLSSNITILQMGQSACYVNGIAYNLKSIVTGSFTSANLYKGTEDHFICENGGFVYAGSGTFAMTKN